MVPIPPECTYAICSGVYSLSEDCAWYPSDQVWLFVDEKRRAAFEDWAHDLGFERIYGGTPRVVQGTPQPTSLILRVPPGSVRDASTLIAKRPGVVSVERNASLWFDEPDFIIQCLRRRDARTQTATP